MSSLAYQQDRRSWQGKANMAATRRAEGRETATQLRLAVQADPNTLEGMRAAISSLVQGCKMMLTPEDYADFYGRVLEHLDHDNMPVLLVRFKALHKALKAEVDADVDPADGMSIAQMVALFEAATA